ncbi:hypothetical protein FMUND_212 [Fusarium mundagurra]|uniref:Uncharacterized protein n=1 Tax=Fusarium mundagurra TaxID=1567541 RepID=A0A8H5Z6M2_9HYPO|nr:hypothetical protein FMUND_212 [Fusarium mundagurra]
MNTNIPLTELEISETLRLNEAWWLGFSLSAPGLSLQEATKGYLHGLSMNSNNFEIPQNMDNIQQDVPILPEACEPLLPLFLESKQAEILAAQTINKLQAPMDYNAETIETEPCLQTDDSNDASGLISTPASPASPSILSTSTQVTTTGASDAPSNEEEGVNGLAMDMQTPESPGCSATQIAIPLQPPQAPVYIDLTREDEPSDGGIHASKPQIEGRRKRKHGHANVHGEKLPLPQARKRSRIERDLRKNELRLRATEILWERGNERIHQVAHRDGHKWSSEDFVQDTGRIIEMEVIVNNGAKQTLRLSKTGQADGQGILWEGDDGFGICKLSLTSKDIESMVGKDYKSVIKECKYIKRDKHMKKYI